MSKRSIIDDFTRLRDDQQTVGQLKSIIIRYYPYYAPESNRSFLREKVGTKNNDRIEDIKKIEIDKIIQHATGSIVASKKGSKPSSSTRAAAASKSSSSTRVAAASKSAASAAQTMATGKRSRSDKVPRIIPEEDEDDEEDEEQIAKRKREEDEIKKNIKILIILHQYQKKKQLILGTRKDFESKTIFNTKNVLFLSYVYEVLLAFRSNTEKLYYDALWYLLSEVPTVTSLRTIKDTSKDITYNNINTFLNSNITSFISPYNYKFHLTYDARRDRFFSSFAFADFKTTKERNQTYYNFQSFNEYIKFGLLYRLNSLIPSSNRELINANIQFYNYIFTDNTINYKNVAIEYSDPKENDYESNCQICYLCGKRLHYEEHTERKKLLGAHIDHIVPLAIAWITGIIHCPVNYIYVHASCNESKNNKVPFPDIEIQDYPNLRERLDHLVSTVSDDVILSNVADAVLELIKGMPKHLQTPKSIQKLNEDIIKKYEESIKKQNPPSKPSRAVPKLRVSKKTSFHKFNPRSKSKKGGRIPSVDFTKAIDLQGSLSIYKNNQIKNAIKRLEGILDIKNGYILYDLIKFFYMVSDIYNLKVTKKQVGGSKIDESIETFFEKFDAVVLNIEDKKEYMDKEDRGIFFKERIVLLMEFSFLLYEQYKQSKNYSNYSDFIVDRAQHMLNYSTNNTLTFFH